MRNSWKKHGLLPVIFAFLLVIFCMTVGSMLYFHIRTFQEIPQGEDSTTEYIKHVAFISEDNQDSFWQDVYLSAKEEGMSKGYYVEAFGDNLSVDYSKNELFSIAIDADVDAIILQGNDIEDNTLWQKAMQKNIPVITVLSDTMEEKTCFVGVNGYNLGRLYGREMLSLLHKGNNRIYVLMNMNTTSTRQNIIYSGIREVLESEAHQKYEMIPWAIQEEGNFGTEETVRDIFMSGEELPDILICLDKLSTTSACQAVVDFNKVGEVNIIGCYTSDAIFHAIKQEVLHATIDFDPQGMGRNCVDALDYYWQDGHVSNYIPINASLITVDNVEEYMSDDEE